VEVPEGPVTPETVERMIQSFHVVYERRYGNRFPIVPVQGVTYRVQLVVPVDMVDYERLTTGVNGGAPAKARPTRTLTLSYYEDEPLQAPEYERDALAPGTRLNGPAVIREGLSTTFVCPGQVAQVGQLGEISIESLR
jgi:N-methylhydantoinase A